MGLNGLYFYPEEVVLILFIFLGDIYPIIYAYTVTQVFVANILCEELKDKPLGIPYSIVDLGDEIILDSMGFLRNFHKIPPCRSPLGKVRRSLSTALGKILNNKIVLMNNVLSVQAM